MIAPYGQPTFSSAYHDGCHMLQTPDIKPLSVNEERRPVIAFPRNVAHKYDSSSATTNNDTKGQPRRRGILSQGKEQGKSSCIAVDSPQEKTKNARKVRFYESVQCLLVVPTRNDYTRDEMRHLWYVDQEYKAIKNEILMTLKHMAKKSENEHICYRGLEFRSKEGALRKTLRRENAYDAVLGEQARQFDLELNDPTLISIMYKRASEESCRDAFLRAQSDAKQSSIFLLGDKRRNGNKRKLFFGLPRDSTINRGFDPSSRAPTGAVMTRHNI